MPTSKRNGKLIARIAPPIALVAAALLGAGCDDQAGACVVATEGCECAPANRCDPGLMCAASVCVKGAGADMDAGMSMVVESPPPPPPLGAGVDAAPRDAGIGLVTDGASAETPGAKPRWTVFVYGHADHNLTPLMLADLAEMSRAKLNADVQVVVLVDWNAKTRLSSKTDETYPAGTFLYRPIGNGQRQLLGTAEELDFDDPTVLADAIALAYTRFPAERYGLVLWDHGGSFRGGYGGDQQDGTRKGNPMSVGAVASAVRAGLSKAGLTGPRPLDFLALDTCLMSGVEVNSAFTEVTKVYIGNAELDYGPGLDYEGTLSWLAANPTASLTDFAKAESMLWDAHHRMASRVDGYYRSHAAWDLTRWGDFVTASRTLATTIRGNDAAAAAARGMFFSLPAYYKGSNANGLDLRDAADVLGGLAGSPVAPVATAAQNALAAARAARIAGVNGQFREQQIGLHLFAGLLTRMGGAPVQSYPQLARDWSQATGWGDLLSYLTGAVPAGSPTFTASEVVPAAPTLRDPPRVTFQTTNPEIAYVESIIFAQDPANAGVFVSHGTIAHGIIGPGEHKVQWKGDVLAIAATPSDVPVTSIPWSFTAEGGMTGSQFRIVNGSLRDPTGQELSIGLLVDQDNQATEFVLNDDSGGFRVLGLRTLVATGMQYKFIPTLEVIKGDQITTQRSDIALIVPESGRFSFRQLAMGAGTYMLGVYVVDVWGKSAGSAHEIRLEAPLAP